ncbi:MAG: RES family NAD+ phosphorylase [Candidatus Dormibacteria bacterium]
MNQYTLGTLTYNAEATTFDFSGTTFRLIPHGSAEPLAFSYSLGGGRWNAPNTFPVMYTFNDTATARQYMSALETIGGFSWSEVQPEKQLDLLVLTWNVGGLVDLATDGGLTVYNLPTTYPSGFEAQSSWAVTQPVGAAIFQSGATGIVARSASATNFSGPPISWTELAIFAERADPPTLFDRVLFDEWYG